MQIDFMGFDLNGHKASIFNDGNDTWSTTTRSSIGLAVKNTILIPDKTANKYVYIDSFTVSQNQVLASCEKATGEKWEATQIDAKKIKTERLEKLSGGDFSGAMSLIRYINCVDGHGGNYTEYKESANQLLSLPKQTLDEVMKGIVKS